MSKKIKHSNGTRFYRKKSTRAKRTKRRRTKSRSKRRTKRRTKHRTKQRTIRKRVNKRKKRKTKQILKGGSTDFTPVVSIGSVEGTELGGGTATAAVPARFDQGPLKKQAATAAAATAAVAELEAELKAIERQDMSGQMNLIDDWFDPSPPPERGGPGTLYDLDTALGTDGWTEDWTIVNDGEGRGRKRNKLTGLIYSQAEFAELMRRNSERVAATTVRLQSQIATPNKITPGKLKLQVVQNDRGGVTPAECAREVGVDIRDTVNNYVSRIKRAEKFMTIHYVLCCDGYDLERPGSVPSSRPMTEGIQFEWDVPEKRQEFRRMWDEYSLIGKGVPRGGQIDYDGLEVTFRRLEEYCESIEWGALPPYAGEEKKVIHVIPELSEKKQLASAQGDKQNGHYLHRGVADILTEICGINLTYQRVSLCESRNPEVMCTQEAVDFYHRDKHQSIDEVWASGTGVKAVDRWRAFNELKQCNPMSTYCTFASGIDMTGEDIEFVSGKILERQLINSDIGGEPDKQAVFIVSHGQYMKDIYGMNNESPMVEPSNMDILHVYVEENPRPEVNAWQSAELFRWPHYISAQPESPVSLLQKVSEINSQNPRDAVSGGGTHYFIMRHCPACHNLKRRYAESVRDIVPDSSGHSSICIEVTPHWMVLAELEPIFSLFSNEEIQFCASIIFRAILTCSLLVEKYRIYRRVVDSIVSSAAGAVDGDVVGGGAIALPVGGTVGDEEEVSGGGAIASPRVRPV